MNTIKFVTFLCSGPTGSDGKDGYPGEQGRKGAVGDKGDKGEKFIKIKNESFETFFAIFLCNLRQFISVHAIMHLLKKSNFNRRFIKFRLCICITHWNNLIVFKGDDGMKGECGPPGESWRRGAPGNRAALRSMIERHFTDKLAAPWSAIKEPYQLLEISMR